MVSVKQKAIEQLEAMRARLTAKAEEKPEEPKQAPEVRRLANGIRVVKRGGLNA
jgi:hypothetical protein